MKMHVRIALVSAAVASVAIAGAGSASAADGKAPPTILLSGLPSGRLAPPPTKKVRSVGAHERVAGVFTTRSPHSQQSMFVAGSRDGLSRLIGGTVSDEESSRDFCLTESQTRFVDGEPSIDEWGPSMQPFVTVQSDNQRLSAIHMERVVEDGTDKATLEVIDAWVDASTRGVRLIGKSKLPMKRIATAPGDIQVFAARDEGRAHLVLVEPRRTSQTWQGILQLGTKTAQSSCRHARSTLVAERGEASTTTFLLTVELPGLPSDAPVSDSGAATPDESAKPAERGAAAVVETIRNRPLRVHASMSWGSRDAEPIVSVTMGWDARDRSLDTFRLTKRRKK